MSKSGNKGRSAEEWRLIEEAVAEYIRERGKDTKVTFQELSIFFDIPSSTLRRRFSVEYGISAKDLHVFPKLFEARLKEEGESYPSEDEETGFHEQRRANTWRMSMTDPDGRIKSLEDLLDYCDVDLSIWEVDRHLINKWEVGRKQTIKRIDYDENGKLHGFTDDTGGITVKELIQVKAWLKRINPISIFPTVAGINPLDDWPEVTAFTQREGILRGVVIPDPHFGFARNIHTGVLKPLHDRRVLDLALQKVEEEEPDFIVFLGDMLDMAEWSTRWPTDPEFYWTTQPALLECHFWLKRFREKAPNAEIYILEGNHNRFRQAMTAHLKAAYELTAIGSDGELEERPLLSMQKILSLDSLNIEFIEGYDEGSAELWITDSLLFIHGHTASSTPGSSAKKVSDTYVYTTIFGHIHRREMVSKKMLERNGSRIYTSVCPGCACHIDGRLPGSKDYQQWQNGFLTMAVHPDKVWLEPDIHIARITDGVMIMDGVEYAARDYDDDIMAMLESKLASIKTRHHRMTKAQDGSGSQ